MVLLKQRNWYNRIVIRDNRLLNYLCVNTTLQKFDEFLGSYRITEGDGMYLAEEK